MFIASSVFSQTGKVLEARNAMATNNLENAKTLIDQAGKDSKFQSDPHYWYWRGYIYKDLYKANDRGKTAHSDYRDESLKSFAKMLEYKGKISPDTIASTMKILNYLLERVCALVVVKNCIKKMELFLATYRLS